jgi:uncharacterized membrane protein YvbJ
MRCTYCGVDNLENAKYCKNCGNILKESALEDISKNMIQKQYKKNLLAIGYLALTFLFINAFSKIYEHFTDITLNGTLVGSVILIIQIIGIIISVYYLIRVYKIKDEITNDTTDYYNRMLKILSFMLILIIISPTFWGA